ncbi:MAG: sulfotransferase [Isosphaeraceae bacterium]|nr:sulfotransferase [Isosphaeraceae bacterium]
MQLLYIIGFGRTGHSILGAMLDAHPNIQVCNDGYHFDATANIVQTLIDGSAQRAATLRYPHSEKWDGSNAPDYDYKMPGWWQGKNDGRLDVIGFKSAHGSVLMHNMGDLDLVNRLVLQPSKLPVKMIVPCRNPYDTIASFAHLMRIDQPSRIAFFTEDLRKHWEVVDHYVGIVGKENTLWTHHEDFVSDPAACLTGILDFLSVSAPTGYLAACKARAFTAQRQTRHLYGPWSADEKAVVDALIRERSELSRYAGSFA